MLRHRSSKLAAALALLLSPAVAHAAGIGRPNVISARSIGWGGSFTAIADDPTALHFNPAGLATQTRDTILIGGEFILAPRVYTPILHDETTDMDVRGEDQSPHNTPIVLPALGYVTRLEDNGIPSRLALGVGVWNTFGGQLRYDKGPPGVAALDYTQTAIIEIVPGMAYEVNDFLQVGAAFRLGLGLFAVEATSKPADGEFSAFGLGAGATFGIMIKPSKNVRVGATYRSAININTKGSGFLILGTTKTDVTVNHTQNWPQQAAMGVHWQASPSFGVAAGADWTDWSAVNQIVIDFEEDPSLKQVYPVDFVDSFALHFGAQYTVSDTLQLRGGYTFDANAVPDRTIERQYLDADKHVVAIGGSYQLSDRWRIDTAFETLFGAPRIIPDNRQEYIDAGFPERANISPGEHSGQAYSLELNVQFQY